MSLEDDAGQRVDLDDRGIAAVDERNVAFGHLNHNPHDVRPFDGQDRHALAFGVARIG